MAPTGPSSPAAVSMGIPSDFEGTKVPLGHPTKNPALRADPPGPLRGPRTEGLGRSCPGRQRSPGSCVPRPVVPLPTCCREATTRGRPSSRCSVPGSKDSPLPTGRPLPAAGPCPPSPPGAAPSPGPPRPAPPPLPASSRCLAAPDRPWRTEPSPRAAQQRWRRHQQPPGRAGLQRGCMQGRAMGKAGVSGDATAVPSAAELLAQQPLNFGLALSSSPPSLRVDPALQKQLLLGPVGAPLLCLWTRPAQPGAAAATRPPPKAPPRDTWSGLHSSPAGRGRSPTATATAPGGCVQALVPAAPPATGLPPRGGVASGRPALTVSRFVSDTSVCPSVSLALGFVRLDLGPPIARRSPGSLCPPVPC